MSELNNDKKVLEQRSAPLKDVDVPLREQVVDKLYDKLKELEIGEKVVSLWLKGSANRGRWLERQKAYLDSWDDHLVANTDGAFEGSSQLHIPMPFVVCKTLHARYLQAIWQDPPFNVKPRNEQSVDNCPTVADTMRYYLMDGANYNKGVEKEVDNWIWRWITTGSGIVKMGWETKYTRFIDVVQQQVPGKPIVQPDGKLQPTMKMVEKEQEVTKKVFDGPVMRKVDIEDLLIIGGNGDPDEAEAVIERDFLDASTLWTYADKKIFREDAVRAVIEGGPAYVEGAIGNEMKEQKAQNAGKSRLRDESEHDRYQILEAYLQVDVNGSGINSDVVVWVDFRSRELLRATYLYRLSALGLRPYAKADFHIREGQEYGVGMPELLYPLSQEMDAMHNMRIDFGLVSVMPFGFYRPSSGIEPETIKFEPGALIPVDNPQTDIFFPNLGNRTVFGMQEEQALQSMVERITSISDLNLGVMNGQGATRTATGARALVGEMSSNLDVYLRRFNRGWKKALRYTLHLCQKRTPAGLSFRLSGEDGSDYWKQVKSQDELQGDFDIEVSPNSSSSNPQVQQENTDFILQLVQNPLLIQMQVVGPGQLWEAVKAAAAARGIKDYGKYFQKPQGYERVLTPVEEADRILAGQEVAISPNSDHQGFIAFFQHFHDTDELMGQFSHEQIALLAIQAKKHEQMMQALQSVQAQQANAQQMSRNASMGQGGGQNAGAPPPGAAGANAGPAGGAQ